MSDEYEYKTAEAIVNQSAKTLDVPEFQKKQIEAIVDSVLKQKGLTTEGITAIAKKANENVMIGEQDSFDGVVILPTQQGYNEGEEYFILDGQDHDMTPKLAEIFDNAYKAGSVYVQGYNILVKLICCHYDYELYPQELYFGASTYVSEPYTGVAIELHWNRQDAEVVYWGKIAEI